MKHILTLILGASSIQQTLASQHNERNFATPIRGGSQVPPRRRYGNDDIIRAKNLLDDIASSDDDNDEPQILAIKESEHIVESRIHGSAINESQVQEAATRLRRELRADTPIRAEFVADTRLPTDVGHFRLRAYRIQDQTNEFVGTEPCVIYSADKPPFGSDGKLLEGVPVRVHDQCMTSEVFRSQRCDCKEQLKMAMEYVKQNGGFIIYLQQEGRGIGIANKVAAYALQDAGYDTVDANVKLGLPEDCRHYGVVPAILADMNVRSIRLMTNNPRKVNRLRSLGVTVDGTVPHVVPQANEYNRKYLETKQNRMSHANFGLIFQSNHMTPRAEKYRSE